jgi:hypothetical protein
MDLADKIRETEALIAGTLPEKESARLLSFCKTTAARKKVCQATSESDPPATLKNDNRDVERGAFYAVA